MPKSIKAKVKKEVLGWARTSAGLSLAEAASRLKSDERKLAEWEEGKGSPTISQLQKLAEIYKRPLSVMYLQEIPRSFQAMRDFRRLPGGAMRKISPELALEIRLAHQRRELAVELSEESGEPPPRFSYSTRSSESPETVAPKIRKLLGVTSDATAKWRTEPNGYTAFNFWRSRIEDLGVLVFQATRVKSEEVSGFAIAASILPVVVVTRTETPPTRRTFTLLHEFAHLMLRVSGVTDLEESAALPPEDLRIEVFCNGVAAAVLMPRDQFLAEPLIANHRGGRESWSDDAIRELARNYGTSREAIVRRLLTFELTTESFYRRKRAQYNAEWRAQREQQREESKADGGQFLRNPPRNAVSDFGRPLINLVLDSYYQDRLSLSDVSGYLGLRTRHIPKLEQIVGRRGA